MSGGGTSNRQGSNLEETVIHQFERRGFQKTNYRIWERAVDKTPFGDELILTHVPFVNIYGSASNTEFLILSKKYNLHIRIECKWQQSSGSVDEKLPYLYLNCIEAMPEPHIIILIDGDGFRAGAKQWLRDTVKAKRYQDLSTDGPKKTIDVMSVSEFMTWANVTLR